MRPRELLSLFEKLKLNHRRADEYSFAKVQDTGDGVKTKKNVVELMRTGTDTN